MELTYNVTTININRIQHAVKVALLKDFIYQSDTDIALLQEFNIKNFYVPGYKEILNIAPDATCGTAIIVKDGIDVKDICVLDSGRGISCKILNTTVVNIYAPSGNTAREERAKFFKSDLMFLLKANPAEVLIGGDFNCVIHKKDQRPNFNYSRELEALVNNMKWKDVWEIKYPTLVKYTYISSRSQSRIDRMYVTKNLENKIGGIEVIPTTFSDHLAVKCSIRLQRQSTYWGRPLWKLNVSMLTEEALAREVEEVWRASHRMRRNYRSTIEWWTLCAKKKLRSTLISYGRERARWSRYTIEFHYSCLRELVDQPISEDVLMNIRKIKAQIISIKRQQLEGLKLKSRVQTTVEEENASLYHLIEHDRKRRKTFIAYLRAEDDRLMSDQKEMLNEVYRFYSTLYADVPFNPTSTSDLLQNIGLNNAVNDEDNTALSSEVTCEEVFDIIKSSPKLKSPGPDGLSIEFYRKFWSIIGSTFTDMVNEMLQGVSVPSEFKESVTVLLPKGRNTEVKHLTKMRPISLMNSDYKIIARVLKERMRPIMNKIIGEHQTCLSGRNIFKTACEYRDIIAIFSTSSAAGGLAFIDFSKAFDRVNHKYLFRTFTHLGFSENFIAVLKNIVQGIHTKVTINGHFTKPIEIRNGVPQGSPLSMILYVIALEPFLRRLNIDLEGITMSGFHKVTNAYADDVGVVIRSNDDLEKLTRIVQLYCDATCAKINDMKSSFLNLNGLNDVRLGWANPVDHHTALGVTFYRCPLQTITYNWRRVLDKIRGAAILNQTRDLNIVQKVKLINLSILSKALYIGQILPVPKVIAKNIMSIVCRFLWKGHIFRVAVDSATLPPAEGGLGLTDIWRKTTALYIKRSLQIIEHHPTSVTAKLFEIVKPKDLRTPININGINYKLKYIAHFYLEISYMGNIVNDARLRHCKMIMEMLQSTAPGNKMVLKYPTKNWKRIWTNISNKVLSSDIQATWFRVVNDVVATNEKLYSIGLSDTNICISCNAIDTLAHRFACSGFADIWRKVKQQVAFLDRSDGREINVDHLLFPGAVYFPAQKTNVVMWLFGHYIHYVINNIGNDSIEEYEAYVQAEYYDSCKRREHKKAFGNMLHILFRKQGIG